MQDYVIETTGLTKRYGDIAAVESLDLRVRGGEVFGFLGANGAGKTTTLRMLLGLIRPTGGHAIVMGDSPGAAASLARIGSMIETPAFYPHLSGRDNLRVLAAYAGIDHDRIDAALAQVELVDRGGDAFRTYSLGMKQRLGVAAALMKDPALLILDEPTNGLDPAGMADMRRLIRGLGDEGRTVIVSSHLMVEVEQVCDRAAVISKGTLVAEGTIDELRGEDVLVIEADPLEEARQLVAGLPGVREVRLDRDAMRISGADGLDPAWINARLVREGFEVRELRRERSSLESVFLSLTNGNADSAPDEGSSAASVPAHEMEVQYAS